MNFGKLISHLIRYRVRVENQIWGQVDYQVRVQVWDQVREQVWEESE